MGGHIKSFWMEEVLVFSSTIEPHSRHTWSVLGNPGTPSSPGQVFRSTERCSHPEDRGREEKSLLGSQRKLIECCLLPLQREHTGCGLVSGARWWSGTGSWSSASVAVAGLWLQLFLLVSTPLIQKLNKTCENGECFCFSWASKLQPGLLASRLWAIYTC